MSGEYGVVADLHGTLVLQHSRKDGYWTFADGSVGRDYDGDARRLVLIDPASRDSVGELREVLFDNRSDAPSIHDMQTALREFANPKPTPCGHWATFWATENAPPQRFDCSLPKGHATDHEDESAGAQWTSYRDEPLADWERDLLTGQTP